MEFHGFDIEMTRPKTIDGKEKIIGVWDDETLDGEKYTYYKFKTLGAKRYMVLNKKGYSLTVSGVNKKIAIPYLLNKYGDDIMKRFEDGLIIPKGFTGKNVHTYIDEETSGTITDYLGNRGDYHELSSVHLEETSYELSISREFVEYLMDIKSYYGED